MVGDWTSVLMMLTALVIMPTTPEVSSVVLVMACAALSNIGLTSEEYPLKNNFFEVKFGPIVWTS